MFNWKQIRLISFEYFQGKLSGYGVEEQLPTVALVAHYDSFAGAPVRPFS